MFNINMLNDETLYLINKYYFNASTRDFFQFIHIINSLIQHTYPSINNTEPSFNTIIGIMVVTKLKYSQETCEK